MPIKIRPKGNQTGAVRGHAKRWTPKVGLVTNGFLDRLKEIGRSQDVLTRIRDEAVAVLGGCVEPSVGGKKTGLVLGRVQSGKTSSFTAVSALAHDNGFKIVIVIAGTTQLLVEQTKDRLDKDLRLDAAKAYERWSACPVSHGTKAKAEAAKSDLRTRLRALCAAGKPLYPGIPIVIVMKNRTHLEKLNTLLQEANDLDKLDLGRLPALIIDDEAHMHTPNVGKDEKDNASAVYDEMRKLREKFPNSSLLQYTATPQANLLMEIQSELSPEFVRLLEPGPGYVGGRELFGTAHSPYVRDVPESDYEKVAHARETDPAPQSLLAAIANFLLVSAVDFLAKNEAVPHAMLVHSDVKVAVHEVFAHWITTTIHSWLFLLNRGKRVTDIPELIKEWADLDKTLGLKSQKLKPDHVHAVLIQVMTNLRVQTVNGKNDVGKVNFAQAPYWIINGGNILGVGYTIEGLVTTHMMRRPGGGMADTIQQRGRFFGYKRPQLNEVRLFITTTMAKRFKDYADHEDGLRASLAAYDASNPRYEPTKGTLKDWKRSFWLDPEMIPTRHNAQRLVLERANIEADGWLAQSHIKPTDESDKANRELIDALWKEVKRGKGWKTSNLWGGDADASSTTHLEAEIPIERLLKLLADYTFPAADQGDMSAAMLAIDAKHAPASGAKVVLMAGASSKRYNKSAQDLRRARQVDRDLRVVIFQGRGKGTGSYVGDRKVHFDDKVTLQIHMLDLFRTPGGRAGTKGGKSFRVESPFLAVHLPKISHEWAKNVLKQP